MAVKSAASSLPAKGNHSAFRYSLVWLDRHIDDDYNRKTLKRLRKIDPDTQAFTNERHLTEYIDEQEKFSTNSSIILIVSGEFSEMVLSTMHDCACIAIFFIHCYNVQKVEHLNFAKLRKIHTEPADLIDDILHCIEVVKTTVSFSLFNEQPPASAGQHKTDKKVPIQNVGEDRARFLWFYKCHQFMIKLENDSEEEMKREIVKFCRHNYQEDGNDEKLINKFEKESIERNAETAIRWYTKNSPLYKCIREAFVSAHIPTIYTLRYFIRLICRQLSALCTVQNLSNSDSPLRLYRGQALPLSQILQLSRHVNDLISFNNFLSTSKKKKVAEEFSKRRQTEDTESVVFRIDVAANCVHSIAIADVRAMSRYEEEEEFLLSIGSVFRIESVTFDKAADIYRVHLSLSNHDQLTVNNYIEQTYENGVDAIDRSILFGKLLFDMGESEFAIQYLHKSIDGLTDNNNHKRPIYLNNLGVCYNEIGEKQKALAFYKLARKIYEQTNNERGVAGCDHNIAGYHYAAGDYDSALNYAIDALMKRPKNTLEQASTHDLLGCIHLARRDQEAANNSIAEGLRIRLKCWKNTNPHHPDIASSYLNRARLRIKSSAFIDAEADCVQALAIYQHNYPQTHPRVKEVVTSLEEIKRHLSH